MNRLSNFKGLVKSPKQEALHNSDAKDCLKHIQAYFVLVPADKAPVMSVVCKMYYINVILSQNLSYRTDVLENTDIA